VSNRTWLFARPVSRNSARFIAEYEKTVELTDDPLALAILAQG
jgi:hypothetical protein